MTDACPAGLGPGDGLASSRQAELRSASAHQAGRHLAREAEVQTGEERGSGEGAQVTGQPGRGAQRWRVDPGTRGHGVLPGQGGRVSGAAPVNVYNEEEIGFFLSFFFANHCDFGIICYHRIAWAALTNKGTWKIISPVVPIL